MHYKIKNTLAGLAVAMSMVGVSYSVGQPPTQGTARAELPAPVGVEVQLDELQAARQSLRGMRSQLSMPFFSFAPLLPRREG
jgi:hypothetical protein